MHEGPKINSVKRDSVKISCIMHDLLFYKHMTRYLPIRFSVISKRSLTAFNLS